MNWLDIEQWRRKDTWLFYKDYEIPFFNVCVEVDVTKALRWSKAQQRSFFALSLHTSINAANMIEPFRYRIRDNGERILIHDVLHPASTVLNNDETFSFCFFQYQKAFGLFEDQVKKELARFKAGEKSMATREAEDDMIYYSILPWIRFTSFAHARKFVKGDSVPRIMFGKYVEEGGVWKMPVSVEVHHALMDGIHVGRFLEAFQDLLDTDPS